MDDGVREKTVRSLALLGLAWLLSGAAWAGSWQVGVLAMRGEEATRGHWLPLESIPGWNL